MNFTKWHKSLALSLLFVSWLLNCQHRQPAHLTPRRMAVPVDSSANFILFDTSAAYVHFIQALDSLIQYRNRPVRILHFGDSHIQADFFPHRLRQQLQQNPLLGNAGRGYFFPARLAGAGADPLNIPGQYYFGTWHGCRSIISKDSCQCGIAGMNALTFQAMAGYTFALDSAYAGCRRIKVYYDTQSDSTFYPLLWAGMRWHMPRRIHRRGYAEFVVDAPAPYTLGFQRLRLAQRYFRLQGIVIENDAAGILYHSAGLNGATVSSYLRCSQLAVQIAALQPDLVIVSLGTNDAYRQYFDDRRFKEQYRELIRQIRRAVPRCSILLTTPGDCYFQRRHPNPHIATAVQRLKELAQEEDLLLWDWFAVMGGKGSIYAWKQAGLANPDLVHLLQPGYELQANLLYSALMQLYKLHKSSL
ncbi:GDSL-type esterase/lipase family protein [Thermonema sp.]|uniref:GDSL-type esterase/lipase family protein n=1 Tax=Thermonema sp. TaxID=2231181 RepID=UPI00258A6439|nr:GDSL-type esterase/lipase family protein [Thermonema sp.]